MSHIDRALSRALTKSVWLTLACLTQSTPSTETATIFNNGGRDAHGDNVQAYLWNVQKSAAIYNIQQWEWGMRAVIMFNAKCSSISLKCSKTATIFNTAHGDKQCSTQNVQAFLWKSSQCSTMVRRDVWHDMYHVITNASFLQMYWFFGIYNV